MEEEQRSSEAPLGATSLAILLPPFLADPEIFLLPLSYQDFLIQKGKSTCHAHISNLLIHNGNPLFVPCHTISMPPPLV